MRCQNCGNDLPEGAKFCGSCGAQVSTQAAAKPAQQKKKRPLWQQLIIAGVAIAFGTFMGKSISNMMLTSYEKPASSAVVQEQSGSNSDALLQALEKSQAASANQQSTATSGSSNSNALLEALEQGQNTATQPASSNSTVKSREYDGVFSKYGLVDTSGISPSLDRIAFVTTSDGSQIEQQEFGMSGGMAKEVGLAYYYSYTSLGVTAAQADEVDAVMQEYFASYFGELDFCRMEFQKLGYYYFVRLVFTDLDDASNVSAMYTAMEPLTGAIPEATKNLGYVAAPDEEDFLNNGYYMKKD